MRNIVEIRNQAERDSSTLINISKPPTPGQSLRSRNLDGRISQGFAQCKHAGRATEFFKYFSTGQFTCLRCVLVSCYAFAFLFPVAAPVPSLLALIVVFVLGLILAGQLNRGIYRLAYNAR